MNEFDMVNKLSLFSLFIVLIFTFSCKDNNKIVLKNIANPQNTISFIYSPERIEEIYTTVDNGRIISSKNYFIKRKDGYYEDVDMVINDTVKDFRKVLVKYDYNYSYDVNIPMPPDFVRTINVSIKKIDDNHYLYENVSANMGIKYFYDSNYKIYKIVRIFAGDSIVYE
jgi:hypothetical protein